MRLIFPVGILLFMLTSGALAAGPASLPLDCAVLQGEEPAGIDEVSGTGSSGFLSIDCRSANFGIGNHDKWIRLVPGHQKTPAYLEVSPPTIDRIEFYLLRGNGWQRIDSGELNGKAGERIRLRNYIVPLEAGVSGPVYMRLATQGTLFFSVNLVERDLFLNPLSQEFFLYGTYYGIMLALALYHLFLYFSLRENAFLFYVLHLLTGILLQSLINGIGSLFLWESLAAWNNLFMMVSVALALVATGMFSLSFLGARQRLPRAYPWLFFLLIGGPLLILAGGFAGGAGDVFRLLLPYSVLLIPVILVSGVVVMRQGYTPARYFVTGFGVLFLGQVVFNLKNMGFLPSGFVTNHAYQIGTVLEALLFSFGLGYRVRMSDLEKRRAEDKAAQAEKENAVYKAVEFTSRTIAHDLKSPLAVFERFIERSGDQSDVGPLKRALMKLYAMAESIKNADVEGIVRPLACRFDLPQIAADQRQLAEAGCKDLEIVGGRLPDLYLDAQKVERAVGNLVKNATEAASGRVGISWHVMDKDLVIRVTDDGPGISAAIAGQIFERGFTWGKEGGSGLGLAFVRHVAEGHGGYVDWSRQAGETCFAMVLPDCVVGDYTPAGQDDPVPAQEGVGVRLLFRDRDLLREAQQAFGNEPGFRFGGDGAVGEKYLITDDLEQAPQLLPWQQLILVGPGERGGRLRRIRAVRDLVNKNN